MRRQRTRAELAICVKYFRERRHQKALINLNKLIEEKPDLAEAYLFRGHPWLRSAISTTLPPISRKPPA
jgi:Tfp pilus assembly protein PilF